MTLLEIFTTLYGEPRKAVPVMDIPCKETSDRERLCKNPLVSVRMVTYNHEKWIAQAIESVVTQQTDFEFELVIGEDCSQDRTREICLDYQKKHPDIIRVLWSDTNVYRIGHGNAGRVTARCRGEFLATCEGDDYWTDPKKLQKQIDLVRENRADACVAFHYELFPDGRHLKMTYVCNGEGVLSVQDINKHYFHTSTYLVRRSLWNRVLQAYPDITSWYDSIMFPCLARRGKFVLLPECVSVYRRTGDGVMSGCKSLQERCYFALRQCLMIILWFSKEFSVRATMQVALLDIAAMYRHAEGYSPEFIIRHGETMMKLFWSFFHQTFPGIKSSKALLQLLLYRLRIMH